MWGRTGWGQVWKQHPFPHWPTSSPAASPPAPSTCSSCLQEALQEDVLSLLTLALEQLVAGVPLGSARKSAEKSLMVNALLLWWAM